MILEPINRERNKSLDFLLEKESEISNSWLKIIQKKSLNTLELEHISKVTKRNKNLQHHPKEHFQDISKNGVALIYRESEIVASILANNYSFNWKDIYERGALWLSQDLRENWLWKFLMFKMTQLLEGLPIVSVTKCPKVCHINGQIMDYEVSSPEWSFKSMLEEWWPLEESYRYFINNELKNILENNQN